MDIHFDLMLIFATAKAMYDNHVADKMTDEQKLAIHNACETITKVRNEIQDNIIYVQV